MYRIEPEKLTILALLDHYERPRNVGSMNKKDMDVGTGLVGAPACMFSTNPFSWFILNQNQAKKIKY